MISNCHKCQTEPVKSDFISCQNENCEEYKLEYLVYEWNKLNKVNESELLNHDDKLYFESLDI